MLANYIFNLFSYDDIKKCPCVFQITTTTHITMLIFWMLYNILFVRSQVGYELTKLCLRDGHMNGFWTASDQLCIVYLPTYVFSTFIINPVAS